MLKIKDNVDLKELEKYGFELESDKTYYQFDLGDNRTYIIVDCKYRQIGIPTSLYGDIPSICIENLSILYDLIKADLVEKVSEE